VHKANSILAEQNAEFPAVEFPRKVQPPNVPLSTNQISRRALAPGPSADVQHTKQLLIPTELVSVDSGFCTTPQFEA
jgi:hypothetical protein